MEFEWDAAKDARNTAKHGVDFAYAARVFADPGHIVLDTIREDDGEARAKAIGLIEGLHYTVVFTLRDSLVRIISARRGNPPERKRYDKG